MRGMITWILVDGDPVKEVTVNGEPFTRWRIRHGGVQLYDLDFGDIVEFPGTNRRSWRVC